MSQNYSVKPLYENYQMLSVDDKWICFCSKKIAEWYVKRCLAKFLDEKTFKLNFEPKGGGFEHESYDVHATELKNKMIEEVKKINQSDDRLSPEQKKVLKAVLALKKINGNRSVPKKRIAELKKIVASVDKKEVAMLKEWHNNKVICCIYLFVIILIFQLIEEYGTIVNSLRLSIK